MSENNGRVRPMGPDEVTMFNALMKKAQNIFSGENMDMIAAVAIEVLATVLAHTPVEEKDQADLISARLIFVLRDRVAALHADTEFMARVEEARK